MRWRRVGRSAVSRDRRRLRNKHDCPPYDTDLARGRPIATGIVEGAARLLIADRLDITGARWSPTGAETLLKLRALISNGDLDAYWRCRVDREQQRHQEARYQQQYQLAA